MNYYNPSFYNIPSAVGTSSPGLFKSLLGGASGIKWGSILSNTQKIIGIANQAIPVIKQVSPVMRNAKTMFKVMNEFKKIDTPVTGTNRKAIKTNHSSPNRSETQSTPIKDSLEERQNFTEQTKEDGPKFFI